MNKKDILKFIPDESIQEEYSKAERGIENELIQFQDNNLVIGFKMAMELIRNTPLGEVEELVNRVLDE